MPKVFPFDQPFQEAVDWFKAKKIVTRAEFDQMTGAMKARAFTAAYVTSAELLNEVYKAAEEGITIGQSYHEYSHRTEEILTRPWHRETVFRTNTLAAYGLGHFQQAKSLAKLRPYARYTAVMDARTRPAHARLHGKLFDLSDGKVADVWPPIGYNCRCSMYTLTEDEVQAAGLEVTDAGDPGIGPDKGFSSPALGGVFDPKTSSWQPFITQEFKKALEAHPELDANARFAGKPEITPWNYTATEGDIGAAQVRVAEEDLGLVTPPKVDPLAWDPDLELELQVKKDTPFYSSGTEIPAGKYYEFKIPGLKQVEIAEEDLLAGLEKKAAAELTQPELAYIKKWAEDYAEKVYQDGLITLQEKPAWIQKTIEDEKALSLLEKQAGKTLKTLGPESILDTAKVDAVKLTPGEEKWIDDKVKKSVAAQKIDYPQFTKAYWDDVAKVEKSTMTKEHLADKVAGKVIPTTKTVALTQPEKDQLTEVAHALVTAKLKQQTSIAFTPGGFIDVSQLSQADIDHINGMVEAIKKKLSKDWTQKKAFGKLDEHIAAVKDTLKLQAKAAGEAIELKAEQWATKMVQEYLAEAPEGAKPTSEWLAKYKTEIKEAYIKKGGVPNVSLSGDAAVGIAKAADPLAPGSWKEFTSRQPAVDYATKSWAAWKASLSSPELQSIRAYKGSGYVPINMWLRKGTGAGSYSGTSVKDLVKHIDTAFNRGKFNEPTKVFRGLSMKLFNDHGAAQVKDLPILKGTILHDKGYPSCGFTERSAWGHKGVVWEIRCPAGTPAAWIDNLGINQGEYEILLGRDLKYRVLDVILDYDWGGRKIPKVISEVIL